MRASFATLCVVAAVACAGGGPTPPDDDDDDDAPSAPRVETDLSIALMDSMARVSDVTIIQQAVPWPQLLAGASIDSLVDDRLEIEAVAWVMLTFTDLDIEAFELPPGRAMGLSNFSRMGLLDIDLQRKPAYAEWERIFQRPLRP